MDSGWSIVRVVRWVPLHALIEAGDTNSFPELLNSVGMNCHPFLSTERTDIVAVAATVVQFFASTFGFHFTCLPR